MMDERGGSVLNIYITENSNYYKKIRFYLSKCLLSVEEYFNEFFLRLMSFRI